MKITRKAHLKIAFMTWGLVGTGLLIFGLNALLGHSLSLLNFTQVKPGLAEGLGLALALTVGFFKGNFVLKKIALKYISRIQRLSDLSPFYMTFAPKNWILVIGMIILGRLVRTFGPSPFVIGVIYVTVGFALVLGARTYLAGHPLPQAKAKASI